MPHWNGELDTSGTPDFLKPSAGDPVGVRNSVIGALPAGVNLRAISWKEGEDVAVVTLEGDKSKVEDFFKKLGVEKFAGPFLTAGERKSERAT